jgi:Zn-dependent metalloprotease
VGNGLGSGGGPIRDFANPAAAGQPDHMNQYKAITRDNGGVHIYSGIHNKAIYTLLTATDSAGNLTFPTQELILLLYLTLTRLTPMSDFKDSRRTLENVVNVYYASTPAVLAVRTAAIAAAFGSVGIT